MDHSQLPAITTAELPQKYQAARLALAECSSVDECKDWADKAMALASYARQSQDKDMEHAAMRIRARAIRRCGELLNQIEKANGKRTDLQPGSGTPTRFQAASNSGLSRDQAITAVRLANVTAEQFEEQVESESPPSVTKLAAQGKKPVNGKPIYEKLGMTKLAFQAGMYFRGDMESYIKAMNRHDPKDVAGGSTKEEKREISANLKIIEKYHQRLKSLL